MTTTENEPSHPPQYTPSNEEIWREIEDAFHESRDFLMNLRLETYCEALEKSGPKWFDPEVGEIQAWLLIPFRKTVDNEQLQFALAAARELIPPLEACLERRQSTPDFLSRWGFFCKLVGQLEAAHDVGADDLGQDRAKTKGIDKSSRENQRRWVACLLGQQLDIGRDRQRAERDVAKAVELLCEKGHFPDGYLKEWFEVILGSNRQLKSTYSNKHLSTKTVTELAAGPRSDLPPTNIVIPLT